MIKKTFINEIENKIKNAIKNIYNLNFNKFIVDKTKNVEYGDFYSNVAMVLGSYLKQNILEINNTIKNFLEKTNNNFFEKIQVNKNGFLNFFLSNICLNKLINFVNKEKENYGQFTEKKLWYNIEFVSANPTGTLHIGHARNAALGQTLSNIFTKYGIKVDREYYINDAGLQIDKLGLSVFYRYLQLNNIKVKMQESFYKGNEPKIVAKKIFLKYGDKFIKEKYNKDSIINKETFDFFKSFSKNEMLFNIKNDLKKFKINFKRYFSETTIYEKNMISKTIKKLSKFIYEKDGAIWLNTTKDGDDKDRVLIKSDKSVTYFTPDICYHNIKLSRGYNKIFDILGADHSSYVNRIRSSIISLGFKGESLVGIIMQMVKLTKNGQEFKMSKRSGNSLTINDLIAAIGVDSARWALISQTSNSHIDINVEEFTNKSFDNNLFYVFYAYARMKKIISKFKKVNNNIDFSLLKNILEKELTNMIIYFPHTIENISKFYEVNKLVNYIYNISNILHSYYEKVIILDKTNIELTNSRILLIQAALYTIKSGLKLMNIVPKNKI